MITRLRKLLVRCGHACVILLAALLVTLLLLLALLHSENGNRWLLQAATAWLPGQLKVENWQGNLLGELHVERLAYQHEDSRLLISHLDWQLDSAALLRLQLHWDRLAAEQLYIGLADKAREATVKPQIPQQLSLPVSVVIERLRLERLRIQQGDSPPILIENIRAKQLSLGRRAAVEQLSLYTANTRVSGHLDGSLSYPYPMVGQLSWQHQSGEQPPIAGQLNFDGNLEQLEITHRLSSPLSLNSRGTIGYRQKQLWLDLKHHWPKQRIERPRLPPIQLYPGSLSSNGSLDKLQLVAKGDFVVTQQRFHLDLEAEVSLEAASIKKLRLESDRQQLTISGRLGYAEGLSWQLDLKGEHLNPAPFWPNWPADIKATLALSGHWQNKNDWQGKLTRLHAEGHLKQLPLRITAQGQAALTAQAANPQGQLQLDARWGQSQISASGDIDQRLDISGRLVSNKLSQLFSEAQGRVALDWQLGGDWQQPTFGGLLQGEQLAWRQLSLGQLNVRARQLNLGQGEMQLEAHAQGLKRDQQTLADNITVGFSGTRQQHRLTLRIDNADLHSSLRLSGGLNPNEQWHGQLQDWRIWHPQLGQWRQQQAASLSVSREQQKLSPFCLAAINDQPGKLCLAASHQQDKLFLDADLEAFPLALANPWLAPKARVKGLLQAEAQLKGSLQQPSGHWQLKVEQGEITWGLAERLRTLRLTQANLKGNFSHGILSNSMNLVFDHQGHIHAQLRHGLEKTSPLSGSLRLQLPHLGRLVPPLPGVSKLKGQLKGALSVAGTLGKPRLQGRIDLSDGSATLPRAGIGVSATQLTLAGTPKGLTIKGSARLGDQPLRLDGLWQPATSPYKLRLKLRGKRLPIINRPEARIFVSPNLSLKGSATGLRLSGKLTVPEAELHPIELPQGAVTVSDDLVLVNAQRKQTTPLPFSMEVAVALGDEVHFEGFGLNAKLGGDLRLQKQPSRPLQLYGNLSIIEGRYRAYGQNLAIDNGQLIFQGPADNPGLAIRAYRKIPSADQLVGVRLSGTLKQPRATLYAEPPLEESQAMSYLLTGQPLNRSSGDKDYTKIAQALAVYGLHRGKSVTQELGDKLGIDEVRIGSEWGGAGDAALMLGKQLSERLYLRYSIGLFSAVSTVMMTYILTETLSLEALSSSNEQTLDLIWQKELD